jgi:DAACS family dicarboxylate/amino acid:cation (Na+ or H+) symporter
VLGALLLHATVTMSVVIRVLVGLPRCCFFRRIRASLVTAFSTSSSSATLPTNLRVGEQRLGIPRSVCGFVYPLGATMCMNGTALFEGITVIFLCQVFGVTLDVGQMAVVMGMAVITSIGAAAVPGGSIPLMVGMLAMFNVPPEGIAVILGVDRILDMARTAVNVLGDHTAAAYIARSEGLCGSRTCYPPKSTRATPRSERNRAWYERFLARTSCGFAAGETRCTRVARMTDSARGPAIIARSR